jgi:hypothetical protein
LGTGHLTAKRTVEEAQALVKDLFYAQGFFNVLSSGHHTKLDVFSGVEISKGK